MRKLVLRLADLGALVRTVPAAQLGLRAVLLVTGAVALVLATQWRVPQAPLAVTAGAALLVVVVAPASSAPLAVMAVVSANWVLHFSEAPPIARTAVLALVLYLFHTTAALCGAVPVTARLDPALLRSWYRSALGVLGGSVLVGVVAYAVDRQPSAVWLDVVGLLGVIAVVCLPVVVDRGRRRIGRRERG